VGGERIGVAGGEPLRSAQIEFGDVRYTSATAVIRDHEDMASGAAPIPKLDLRASQRFAPSYADALPTDQMPFTRDDLAETVQEHPTDDAIRRSFGLVTEQNPAVPRPESVTAGPGRVQHGDIHQASTRDLPAIAPPLDPDDGGRLPLIGVLIVATCVGLAIWLGVRFIAQSSQQAKTPPIKAERIEESEADSTTPEEENKQTEPEAEPIACTTHSACSALSKTARCGPKHMCIEAVTERCSTVDGSLQDDDAILIGSIAKRLLEGDSGVAIQNGVALAVTEINNQGGLPGGRKLVHVECNSEGTASGALEASRHLINNLNVHSIVGPGRSKAFLEVIPFAVRKGVMLISPSATSPVLTNLDDKGLGWRTAASDRQQAFAIADLLAQRKYTRIAALVYDDVYAQALLDNIRARFESNTGQKHAIIARIYTDPSSDKFNNTLSALIDKVPSPQAVLVLGHEEVADVIRAHHKASAGKLTHYMVSEGGRKTRTVALTQEFPKLSGLIEGVANIHQNGTLFEQFSNRYQTRFGTAPPTHAANAYDAVYLLTYATVAVGDQREPTGARLAKAMLSVVPDHCTQPECRIEVGPAHWAKAIERLTNDQNIDFEGASGKLDFDMKTGDITADVGLWTLTKANPKQFSRVGIYAKDKDNVLGWTFTR
ncbi:MAG: ABC transporter substrate-binding protein, partial [Myxococcota bacterium]